MDANQVAKEIRTAIKKGDADMVIGLIQGDETRLNMDTPFGSWLHVAATHGKLDIVKRLVAIGADIEAHGSTANGTPLLAAASSGNVEIVRYLLDLGATMEVDRSERNPLFAAIDGRHTEVAKVLIEAGINTKIGYKDSSGKARDALSYAREWGSSEIAAMLERAT